MRARDQQGVSRLVLPSETDRRLEMITGGTGPPYDDGVSSDDEESHAAFAKRASDFSRSTTISYSFALHSRLNAFLC